MTLITPEHQEIDRLKSDVEALREILHELKEKMSDLRKQVQAGEVESVKEAGKTLQELRAFVKLSMETEAQLNEIARREQGLDRPYALDLDEARRQIGCRLARIAPCCRAGRVAR